LLLCFISTEGATNIINRRATQSNNKRSATRQDEIQRHTFASTLIRPPIPEEGTCAIWRAKMKSFFSED
jgi:hypothetical protein